ITLEQGSTGNKLLNNTISASGIYGIYALGGSDSATITGNTISGSGKHGIYFKTGKNTIANNTVTGNGSIVDGVPSGSGIASYLETDIAAAVADLVPPGASVSVAAADPELVGTQLQASAVAENTISHNTISQNVDEGIELKNAAGTTVESNVISGNGSNGVYMASATTGTMVTLNTISNNDGYGIRANGLDVSDNEWTKNIVFDNHAGGITITSGANDGIPAPSIVQSTKTITLTTTPGSWVELYSDNGGQGRFFEARVKVDSGTLVMTRAWKGKVVNATATDAAGNTSAFAVNRRSMRIVIPIVIR
ncbi:MAG TPA: right-handed parallel beta-helix repeat-containing protein, partial [Roseiflexaceae bacterium]|nr:right-handed parallel beta-helix repeat-containing protein [Roseiflexaceae bacterium]